MVAVNFQDQNPDLLVLRSLGVDIGSATSHLTYSEVTLRRDSMALSSQYEVSSREELYRSDIMLTPYLDEAHIDAAAVESFIAREYGLLAEAHGPADTGVVIVTGEAANRDNAPALAKTVSMHVGSSMCVAAGPHYEALLAAHGSGAVEASANGRRILNVDIGGGTTKLSVVQDGELLSTAALSVGARLLALGATGRAERIEPPLVPLLAALDEKLAMGDDVTDELRRRIAHLQATLLLGVIFKTQDPRAHDLVSQLWVTDPLPTAMLDDIDAVTFSGGVAEYILGHSDQDFGDLGIFLGEELKRGFDRAERRYPIMDDSRGIRATVIGAGQYSIRVSGITSYVTDGVLPLTGLKVVAAVVDDSHATGLADRLLAARNTFALDDVGVRPCYALVFDGQPDYFLLKDVARELLSIAHVGSPLVVALNADVAFALGVIISAELGWSGELVVLDGISAGDLDYADIGAALGVVDAIPVILKSLTFMTRKQNGLTEVSR